MNPHWITFFIAWAALDLGFLLGAAWVASRRPLPNEHTIYVPYYPEPQKPVERFAWKAGIGVE